MYDWAEVQGRTDAFWDAIRRALPPDLPTPRVLDRPDNLTDPWSDPGLVLGQTCGLPYVSGRCGDAVLVGRPVYDTEGAGLGTYCSAIICRVGDAGPLSSFLGRRAAVNERGSQSGHNALADAVADLDLPDPFFGDILLSGSHRRSAAMVAEGQADIAAVDAIAWALFAEIEPERHARLRVVSWTRPMPSLPFITGPSWQNHREEIRRAVVAGCVALRAPGIPIDILAVTDSDYDPIRRMAKRLMGRALV